LRNSSTTYTYARNANGKGGDATTTTIKIDTSQRKGLIEGQIAHETDHERHKDEDKAKFDSNASTSLTCKKCPEDVHLSDANGNPMTVNGEPADVEEGITYEESYQVTREDPEVQWLGPPWGADGGYIDYMTLTEWIGKLGSATPSPPTPAPTSAPPQ